MLITSPTAKMELSFHQVYPESWKRLEATQDLRSLSCKWLSSHRKRVSSANWRWEIGGAPSLTKKPANSPLSSNFLVNLLSASVTIMNRKEESGSPCRRPLELWKKPVGEPFTRPYGVRGTMPSVVIHTFIHFLHFTPNSILIRKYLRNPQLTWP